MIKVAVPGSCTQLTEEGEMSEIFGAQVRLRRGVHTGHVWIFAYRRLCIALRGKEYVGQLNATIHTVTLPCLPSPSLKTFCHVVLMPYSE